MTIRFYKGDFYKDNSSIPLFQSDGVEEMNFHAREKRVEWIKKMEELSSEEPEPKDEKLRILTDAAELATRRKIDELNKTQLGQTIYQLKDVPLASCRE